MLAAVLDEAAPARGPGQDINYKQSSSYCLLPKTHNSSINYLLHPDITLHYVLHPFAIC